MDTKRIQDSRKKLFRRLVTVFGLWFGLVLFLMAATSLRRFTTPAVASDDATPAAAPNQGGAQPAVPELRPLSRVPSSQEPNRPSKLGEAVKQRSADANPARPAQPQKPSLRSDAGALHSSTAQLAEAYSRLPIAFESNQGQTDQRVRFLARGSGYTLFLTGNETVLRLQAREKSAKGNRETRDAQFVARFSASSHRTPSGAPMTMDAVRMRLVAANPSPEVRGVELLPGRSNYFIGKQSTQWHTGIPTYAKVRYHDVYPGVDLVYYGNQRQLEYDFVVAPGADPEAIKLSVTGASKPLSVDGDGNLVVDLRDGNVRFHKPVIYQTRNSADATTRQSVDGRFVVQDKNLVAFRLGTYDRSKPLVIDPVLSYSTFLGGTSFDEANAIAVDSNGNAYITGETTSVNFPGPPANLCSSASSLTCGPNNNGFNDVFVAKINTNGSGASSLVYSAYLGGSGNDFGQGIAVDSSGNAYVAGGTDSTDFPTTASTFQATLGGGQDAFVTELNPSGNALVYSTYLGGGSFDQANAIAVDASGNAYVTGLTNSVSPGFPTQNPYQGANAGAQNAFVTKLAPGGATLVYSTYLGGTGTDVATGIALDASGNAYVTGSTTSGNSFPAVNPIATGCATCAAGDRVFVTEMNSAGSAPVYSTLLGGSGISGDFGSAIAVDSGGNTYVTGTTNSPDFPTLKALAGSCSTLLIPSCPTGGAGDFDAFVTKLTAATVSTGPTLAYSTYLGGTSTEQALGIAIDSFGNAFVTGYTGSSNFPTANSLSGSCTICPTGGSGDTDAFVTEIVVDNSGNATLGYSTYLGGSFTELAFGVAVDANSNAYVAGITYSDGSGGSVAFPTVNAAQAVNNGGGDAFVAKLTAGPIVSLSGNSLTFGSTQLGTTSGSQSVTLSNTGTATLNITNITLSGDFVLVVNPGTSCPYTGGSVGASGKCTIDVAFKPTALGVRNGSVSIADNAPGTPQSVSLSGTGIDTTPPAVTISANPSAIHVRNGSMVPVTVSGTITDSGSGVNPSTAAFKVVDEYGLVQPSGPVTLGAGGNYSFIVRLQASRLGSDLDGRQYTITVSAQDNAGNLGSVSTVVTVLHNN